MATRRRKQANTLNPDQLTDAYRNMYLSRRLDDKEIELKKQNRIYFQISGAGHEAILTAAGMVLKAGHDYFLSYYRDRALMLQLGMTATEVLYAAVGAKADPTSGGRQMPCHWGHRELNVISKSSCTGTQYLQGVGAAEASWYREAETTVADLVEGHGDEVVLITSGEGTTSEGEFFEALNTAANKKLPTIFLIEDNGYAISVPVEVQTAGGSISKLVGNYPNLKIIEVDGCDIEASFKAMEEAADWCRRRKGPALVHAQVVRPYSHSMSDDERAYKSEEERVVEQEGDPLARMERLLVARKVMTEDEIASLKQAVDAEISVATETALAAPTPEAHEVYDFIYAHDHAADDAQFDTESNGTMGEANKTMVDLLNSCLQDEMERDHRVVVFGQDVADASREAVLDQCKGKGGVFKVTHGLQKRFGGQRVFNSPLAEANIVGRAIGMAERGLKPVVEIQFLDYIWPAFQQIRNELATARWRSHNTWPAPVVIRTPSGGYLKGGAPYHSQSAETLFTHIPGLRVVMPSTALDANGLLRTAIRCEDPVIFLEPKHLYRQTYNKGPYPGKEFMIPFGKGKVVESGNDLTLVTYGSLVHRSRTALKQLQKVRDCSVELIDLRSLSPYDWPLISSSVKRTGRALIVHEETRAWGYGAEIASRIGEELFEWLDAPVRRVAALDSFVGYHPTLEDTILPQVRDIVEAVSAILDY